MMKVMMKVITKAFYDQTNKSCSLFAFSVKVINIKYFQRTNSMYYNTLIVVYLLSFIFHLKFSVVSESFFSIYPLICCNNHSQKRDTQKNINILDCCSLFYKLFLEYCFIFIPFLPSDFLLVFIFVRIVYNNK